MSRNAPDHSAEKDASAVLRQFGYEAAIAALRDAADDVPDWVIPKGPEYVRRWLRARADHFESRHLPPAEGKAP